MPAPEPVVAMNSPVPTVIAGALSAMDPVVATMLPPLRTMGWAFGTASLIDTLAAVSAPPLCTNELPQTRMDAAPPAVTEPANVSDGDCRAKLPVVVKSERVVMMLLSLSSTTLPVLSAQPTAAASFQPRAVNPAGSPLAAPALPVSVLADRKVVGPSLISVCAYSPSVVLKIDPFRSSEDPARTSGIRFASVVTTEGCQLGSASAGTGCGVGEGGKVQPAQTRW